jgi:hypothetical protein
MARPLVERTAAHKPSLYARWNGMVSVREVKEWETAVITKIEAMKNYIRQIIEEEPRALERERKVETAPVPKGAFKDLKERMAFHREAAELQLVRIRQELRVIQAVDSSYTLENKPTLESSLNHARLPLDNKQLFNKFDGKGTYNDRHKLFEFHDKNALADYIFFLARDGTAESNKKLEDIKRLFITPEKIPTMVRMNFQMMIRLFMAYPDEVGRIGEVENYYFSEPGRTDYTWSNPNWFPLLNDRYGPFARPKIFEGLVKAGKAQRDAWHASGNAALAQQQRQALATKTPAEQAVANAAAAEATRAAEAAAAEATRAAEVAAAKANADAEVEAKRRANAEVSEAAAEAVRKTAGVREAGLSVDVVDQRVLRFNHHKLNYDTEILAFETLIGGHITGAGSNYTDFIDNEEHQKNMLSTIARIRNFRKLMAEQLALADTARETLERNKYATEEQKTVADNKIATSRTNLQIVIEDLSRPIFNGKTL